MSEKNILLLVEGESTETTFFDNYGKSLMGESNIKIVSYKCNIYAFYNFLKEYDFQIDLVDGLLLWTQTSEEEKKILANKKFIRKYLVFDFDFQENSYSFEQKVEILKQMSSHFNNESDNGLLFINFPMFEAYREKLINQQPATFVVDRTNYKDVIDKRGKKIDASKLKHEDFIQLIRESLFIESFILNEHSKKLDYSNIVNSWYDSSILESQLQKIEKDGTIYCYNSSVQMAMSYFGEKFYKKL